MATDNTHPVGDNPHTDRLLHDPNAMVTRVRELGSVLDAVRVSSRARKLKRNPYFCKICGLSAEYHTEKEYETPSGEIFHRAMCSPDIESDLDPDLVHKVLLGIVPGDGSVEHKRRL